MDQTRFMLLARCSQPTAGKPLLFLDFVRLLLPLLLVLPLSGSPPGIVHILDEELQRNFSILKQKADPPPYFMSYEVTEEESQIINASLGAINSTGKSHNRYLDITIRVGSPKLDNYHILRG